MTNFDRNTRTLIVSFVIAIFALIPLRFVEAGEQQYKLYGAQVLGESVSIPQEEEVLSEDVQEVKIEAPYDSLESCVSSDDILEIKNGGFEQYISGVLNEDDMILMLQEVKRLEQNICK